ncbi:MAG: O-unit flippase-like protein [Candidatus Cryptobacteroides sp.]
MGVDITRKDVIWSYVAKFFLIGSGLVTLPLILNMLTSEEVGMNYLMLTVGSIVGLLDFGFSPQFGRNFTYVNSGARSLLKEGVMEETGGEMDWHLLSVLIKTARYVYTRLSLIALAVMLTFGTAYIWYLTEGFTNVQNSLYIWILYSFSTYFNIYFSYYSSLLTGSGMVKEASQAAILSKSAYMLLCVIFLLLDWGLFAVVAANFIAPFVQRLFCYRVYFTPELKSRLGGEVSKDEINSTFKVIWFNAKKLGINFLGAYAVNKMGMFIIGFFLPLAVIGSYGLLTQLSTIVSGVANTLFVTFLPKLSNLRVTGRKEELRRTISFTVVTGQIVMLAGAIAILFAVPPFLKLIHSSTELPSFGICALYLLVIALELNHSEFASVISTSNRIPYVVPSLISGGMIVLLTFIVLKYTAAGLFGVVLVQGIVQAAYNNWRWPLWVFRELDMTVPGFYSDGFSVLGNKISSVWKSMRKSA